jgi:uncharacterized coiled-coil protein SlyX
MGAPASSLPVMSTTSLRLMALDTQPTPEAVIGRLLTRIAELERDLAIKDAQLDMIASQYIELERELERTKTHHRAVTMAEQANDPDTERTRP